MASTATGEGGQRLAWPLLARRALEDRQAVEPAVPRVDFGDQAPLRRGDPDVCIVSYRWPRCSALLWPSPRKVDYLTSDETRSPRSQKRDQLTNLLCGAQTTHRNDACDLLSTLGIVNELSAWVIHLAV